MGAAVMLQVIKKKLITIRFVDFLMGHNEAKKVKFWNANFFFFDKLLGVLHR